MGAVSAQVTVLAAPVAVQVGLSSRFSVVSGNDVVGWPHTRKTHVVGSSTAVAYHACGLVVVKVPYFFVG